MKTTMYKGLYKYKGSHARTLEFKEGEKFVDAG